MSFVFLAVTLTSCQEGEHAPEPDQDTASQYRAVVEKINEQTGATQIDVGTLRGRLDAGQPTVVLDIRERAEHDVAAIRDARWIAPSEVSGTRLEVPADAFIIAYCTAGYRSGLAAVKLSKQLGRPVLNLDGGLIAWFNSGGTVIDAQGNPASRIHTFSDDWAKYVTR